MTVIALVVGPIDPATKRRRPGVDACPAASRASSAARRLISQRPVGQAVLGQHQRGPAEGIRLDHVRAGVEVLRVHPAHEIGAGQDQVLVAALELRAPEVLGSQVLALHPGARGPVEDQNPLGEELLERLGALALGGTGRGGSGHGGRIMRDSRPPGNSADLKRPWSGSPAGGTNLSITGTDFQAGAAVTIGGVAAGSVVVNNSNSISATSPLLAAGTVNDLTVANPDGSEGTLPKAWVADFLDVPNGQRSTPSSRHSSGTASPSASAAGSTASATRRCASRWRCSC